MNKVIYQGITFYADICASKTEKDFSEHEAHHGLTKPQLSEVWKLCKEAVKPVSPSVDTTVN